MTLAQDLRRLLGALFGDLPEPLIAIPVVGLFPARYLSVFVMAEPVTAIHRTFTDEINMQNYERYLHIALAVRGCGAKPDPYRNYNPLVSTAIGSPISGLLDL